MRNQSTLVCRSCKRDLPRSCFDPRFTQRAGSGVMTTNGLHTRCRECRQQVADRIKRPEYIIDPVTGCWNWNRTFTPNGYGITGHNPAQTAHRYMFGKVRGPIPDGLTLDHLCRNRACVNPDHLEPVPQVINSQRGARTILDAESVRMIRSKKGTMRYRDIGELFGVAYSTIASIMNGSRWWNVDDDAA